MNMHCFNITQHGTGPIKNGMPCQEFSGFCKIRWERTGHDAIVAAVAKGIGGSPFSGLGSRIAVNAVLDYMRTCLPAVETADDRHILPVMKAAFLHALKQIMDDACANGRLISDMSTTLTMVIHLDDGTLWCGNIGDNGVVAIFEDGTYDMIVNRNIGSAANTVFSLSKTEKWGFGRAIAPVAALALMTSGVLNVTVTPVCCGESVYFPMIGAPLTNPADTEEELDEVRAMMDAFFASDAFRARVPQDITFVAIRNEDMVAALPEINFDQKAWDETQKRIREKILSTLNRAAE